MLFFDVFGESQKFEKILLLKMALKNTKNRCSRADKYLDLACGIMSGGAWIEELKKDGICEVDIYGNSMFGNAVMCELERAGIQVAAFIDRNLEMYCSRPLYNVEEYLERYSEKRHVVINTVPVLNDLVKVLLPGVRVYNLVDIIKE